MTYSKAIAIIDGTRQEIITNSTELDKALKKLEHEIAPWFKTEDKKSFQDFKNSELAHFTARVTQFEEKKRKGQLNAENLKVETSEITDSALKILIKLEEKITDIYLEQIKNGTYQEVNFEEIELLSNKSHTPFLKSFAFVFETHKKEVKDFKNDITQYKEKEQQSKIDIGNFEKKVEELENSITQYKEKEQQLKIDVSNFEKKVEELENSITQYKEKENTLNNNINNLEKERDKYKDITSKYQKAEPGLNMYISDLEGDISKLEVDKSKLEGDKSKLKNDIHDKTDRLKRHKIINWLLGVGFTIVLLLLRNCGSTPPTSIPCNKDQEISKLKENIAKFQKIRSDDSTKIENLENKKVGIIPLPPKPDTDDILPPPTNTPKIYYFIKENDNSSREDISYIKNIIIFYYPKAEQTFNENIDLKDDKSFTIKVVPWPDHKVKIGFKTKAEPKPEMSESILIKSISLKEITPKQ